MSEDAAVDHVRLAIEAGQLALIGVCTKTGDPFDPTDESELEYHAVCAHLSYQTTGAYDAEFGDPS
jgi:hypothetical protein